MDGSRVFVFGLQLKKFVVHFTFSLKTIDAPGTGREAREAVLQLPRALVAQRLHLVAEEVLHRSRGPCSWRRRVTL